MSDQGRLTFYCELYVIPHLVIRQAGILVREVVKFQKNVGYGDWPCIISGGQDFLLIS
jgi:hypothetical protein